MTTTDGGAAPDDPAGGLVRRLRDRAAPWVAPQRLRLASGLVLFAFALTHFLNHALGIWSVGLMEDVQDWRTGFWRSTAGFALLVGALVVHVALALWKTARRRTLRMPPAEAAQLVLGLAIPLLLAKHVAGTAGLAMIDGVEDSYTHVLSLQWPSEVFLQTLAMLTVWIHACIGLHFWLRLNAWYRRWRAVLLTAAVAVPLLAEWGFVDAARRLWILGQDTGTLTPDQQATAGAVFQATLAAYGTVLAVTLLVMAVRLLPIGRARRIAVTYPGNRVVRVAPGPSVLEISRMNGIPHAAVCGGRARCSTCRTRILDGLDGQPEAGAQERAVLERIGADPGVRLACQLRPTADLTVQPLLPARETPGAAIAADGQDAYHWGVEQPVAVLFVDLRGFTSLSERRLTYDVVFILNRYLDAMARAVRAERGYVDKFIGDGVMAIFGMTEGVAAGSRSALAAAVRMQEAMAELNRELEPQLGAPLRIGIGIHVGPAILGRVGAAGGGATAGITALGDTVNTASRLETLTKEYGAVLVVSHAVVHAAKVELAATRVEEITVRGRQSLLKVYAITDVGPLARALAAPA
ncbi:adenylate/guanylate cyclase domain-containing protein [Pseudoxanthobacter sp. M-2]|uniref:adenylate/guanylate cyclase domain-containing protein n=1 Tax=Pseudoxanthobacter sp. M-2 TaxID=3078754 RepID=UPI0038FCCDAF